MPDAPDEMPESPDVNTVTADHGLSVEPVLPADDQLKAALDASGKKPESHESEAEDYQRVLAEQDEARKHRGKILRTIGVTAATGAIVFVTVSIIKSHSGRDN